jgi:F-type H+-transporting ATPase subunit b
LSLIRVTKKLAIIWTLAVFLTGIGGAWLHAQEAPAQSQNNSDQNQNLSPGRQLAQETRETAGEEKNSEFKQSESVRLIARLTGMNPVQSYWLCVMLNFAVIAGLIVWAWKKRVPEMFRTRTAGIQTAMIEAQKASEEARRRLAEIESRLSRIDVEIGAMRQEAAREAAAEDSRIKAAAEEEARNIVAGAQQEIAAAARAARRQLASHAADLAVGLAQKQMRIDAGTDQALVRNFASELAGTPDNIGKDGH